MTDYNAPFLTPEQRVNRLFEINAVENIKQALIEVLHDSFYQHERSVDAAMVVIDWARTRTFAINHHYQILAVQNAVTRKVTTWVA